MSLPLRSAVKVTFRGAKPTKTLGAAVIPVAAAV
jgi:hypothetical protein